MNITAILLAAAIVGGAGLFIGIFLGVSGKKFAVEVDEREEAILDVLPGNNCGGCGYQTVGGIRRIGRPIIISRTGKRFLPVLIYGVALYGICLISVRLTVRKPTPPPPARPGIRTRRAGCRPRYSLSSRL